MFVITNNNQVIYGPAQYDISMFKYILVTEAELEPTSFQLPTKLVDTLVVTDTINILKVSEIVIPNHNSKIEQLAGPFYVINETDATISYTVTPKTLDSVKNDLKAKVAEERYKTETKDLKLTVAGTEVIVEGSRENKTIFLLSYAVLPETGTSTWKFPKSSNFVACSRLDIGGIIQAFMIQTQTAFDWQATKNSEIDACTTLEALDAIVLTYEVA